MKGLLLPRPLRAGPSACPPIALPLEVPLEEEAQEQIPLLKAPPLPRPQSPIHHSHGSTHALCPLHPGIALAALLCGLRRTGVSAPLWFSPRARLCG